jgi:hypothetical protein
VRYSVLLLLLFCSAPAAGQGPWSFRNALEARRTGSFADRRLDEASGVAVSRRNPGMLWTHNDGPRPVLYATDTLGAALGTVRIRAAVDDWEDVAPGPCGKETCLYLADTGDNRERRGWVKLLRIREPTPADARRGSNVAAEGVRVRYPDGAHDVEAMWVDPNGDTQLVTKGRSGEARQFRVPAAAWRTGKAVAERMGALPIDVTRRLDGYITGAGLSPDGRLVALRTYRFVYFFERGARGELQLPPKPVACSLGGIDVQGEGVAWLDGERLVLTSERAVRPSGTVSVVRCPLPRPAAEPHSASGNPTVQ